MQPVRALLILLFISLVHGAFAQLFPSFGNSRTGSSGMQFLKIGPDARSLSLAGAGVATANDVSATYWNPAAITEGDTARLKVHFAHTRYFGDISGNFSGAVFKPGKYSYMGISVFAMNYGTMDETTEFEPTGTGRTFTVSNYSIALTYARVLTNNFSFGVNTKFANEGFAGVNINNILFDLGLKYNVGIKNARFGINFSNFGLNVKPDGEMQILKFSGEETVSNFTSVTVPAIFRLGAAFDPIQTHDHNLSVIGQLNHPTDNNETYALATEYSYMQLLYGRLGYEFATDTRYSYPSAGMGLRLIRNFGGINIDYAILTRNVLGNVHRIGLTLVLR
jgi:hypothetical protein